MDYNAINTNLKINESNIRMKETQLIRLNEGKKKSAQCAFVMQQSG